MLSRKPNRCKFPKLFISIKVTEYIRAADYGLRKPKMVWVWNGNLIVLK